MSGEILQRDQNFVTVIGAITNDSAQEVRMVQVDPLTNRVLVDASGIGTVTSVSIVSANGFAGTVANATTTPAITLSTTVTGIVQGDGTTFSAITIGTGLSFIGGLLSSTATGAVSSVSNSDGTLTISPTTGDVVASLNLAKANTWTALQTFNANALAATTADSALLSNTTAAINGTQQVSPSLHWSGLGFGTTAGTSQDVSFRAFVLPVQSTIPTGTWQLQSSIAGSAYTNRLTVSSGGTVISSGSLQGTTIQSGANATAVAFQSTTTLANSNFASIATDIANSATASLLFGGAAGVNYRIFMNGAAASTMVVGNSYGNLIIGSAPVATAASGTHAWLANAVIKALGTVTAGGATVTNTATLYIDAAGSGGTNNYSIYAKGTIGGYNDVKTAGWGVPAIYGSGRSTGQTAAVASVATYTCGAADGSFVISANANITSFVAGTFNVTVAYTDETNTARTLTLNFSSLTGTLGIALAAAGPFEGIPAHIRCKASTAITIATSGTFTSLTYNVEGSIRQIA